MNRPDIWALEVQKAKSGCTTFSDEIGGRSPPSLNLPFLGNRSEPEPTSRRGWAEQRKTLHSLESCKWRETTCSVCGYLICMRNRGHAIHFHDNSRWSVDVGPLLTCLGTCSMMWCIPQMKNCVTLCPKGTCRTRFF